MKESKKLFKKRLEKKVKPEDIYDAIAGYAILIMSMATSEYAGRLGLIPIGTKVNWEKVGANLNPFFLFILGALVSKACYLFGLAHPQEKNSKKETFRKWFEETGRKMGRKGGYDEWFFGKIPKVSKNFFDKIKVQVFQ